MTAGFRVMLIGGLTLLAIAIGIISVVRLSPMTAARWQVNPEFAQKQPGTNDYLLRPYGAALNGADGIAGVYQGDAASLTLRLQQVALAEPRTRLIAGDDGSGVITLVQRSRWMGFPDAISIMARDIGPGVATLAIWSRSRFGENDFGVNRARVTRWLAEAGMTVATGPQSAR